MSSKTINMPLIDGAYCFNNGSGICKAFAGRYEFFYDSFNDKFLNSAPESEYVDANGYHKRVPVSYTIDGNILYADRSINWARKLAQSEFKGKNVSLLSIDVVNWCAFVAQNYWPYKSAIKHKQYQIYFFNRQSCIIDTSKTTQPKQHYNTRFLHNSSVRIDLDMNPTIYAMEDNIANEIRLVKNKRQHWNEVAFKVLEKPSPEVDYFVDMEPTDKKPCKICGGRPMLPKTAYRPASNVCLSDNVHERARDGNNAQLVAEFCGTDKVEIADFPSPTFKKSKSFPLEVDLHNIPRRPTLTTSFFGVDIKNEDDWVIWAKDGLTFSAATTIPTNNENEVRVIMLYASFTLGQTAPKYEEYDPMPYLADYTATFKMNEADIGESTWVYDRESAKVQAKNLNYVDDIAYLYKCNSLLVIFGPFYSELSVDKKIDLSSKGPIDSIYELGIWEPVNAFFAMPDGSNVLWVYHRTNYLAEYLYECNKPLVTAKRNGTYRQRYGPGSPPVLNKYYSGPPFPMSEETLFQHIGVYKGNLDSVDAPDPVLYENAYVDPTKPEAEKDQTYIYIIIAIGILLIVTMCIICMIAVRRRIKRRRHMKTIRSGNLEDDSQAGKSARSVLSWLPFVGSSSNLATKTRRSAMSPAHSHSKKGSSRLPDTVRSTGTSTPTKSAATIRSPSLNSSHRGSKTSLSSGHSKRPHSASSHHSAGGKSHHSLSGSTQKQPTSKQSAGGKSHHSLSGSTQKQPTSNQSAGGKSHHSHTGPSHKPTASNQSAGGKSRHSLSGSTNKPASGSSHAKTARSTGHS